MILKKLKTYMLMINFFIFLLKMEEFNPFECKICKQYFTNPVCFCCGHCVCSKCIVTDKPFNCPICDKRTKSFHPIYGLEHKYSKDEIIQALGNEKNEKNEKLEQLQKEISENTELYNSLCLDSEKEINELTEEYENKKNQYDELCEKLKYLKNTQKQLKILRKNSIAELFGFYGSSCSDELLKYEYIVSMISNNYTAFNKQLKYLFSGGNFNNEYKIVKMLLLSRFTDDQLSKHFIFKFTDRIVDGFYFAYLGDITYQELVNED